MFITKCVLCVVILVMHVVSCSWAAGARQRCAEQMMALQDQMTHVQETQELLQEDLTALKDSINTLSNLVVSTLPEDCSVARARGSWSSTTEVRPPGLQPRKVRCDQQTGGGGWTVVLARFPTTHLHLERCDFNRSWQQYKQGFGDIHGEFWIGNEALHSLTKEVQTELRVTLSDWEGNTTSSVWQHFRVGSETDHYKLTVGGYEEGSKAGDSLHHHNNHRFSTYDNDNDRDYEHCARKHGGGWWYFSCYQSHLTGAALPPNASGHHAIVWRTWKHIVGLREVTMMIRPAPRPFSTTP
ncbi:ficolin-2-like [Homarus americanus]|uniref:ficolin-2-like n=1 Tax=Homarus americanus TaxID=6706 RepID=UPI001C472588|nr:ficolin-2-like [Homarus americanus]